MKNLILLISFCLICLTWKGMGLGPNSDKATTAGISEKWIIGIIYNKQTQLKKQTLTRSLMLKPETQIYGSLSKAKVFEQFLKEKEEQATSNTVFISNSDLIRN